jgi:hypothetical protein
VSKERVKHPELGELVSEERDSDLLTGSVMVDGRVIALVIEPDSVAVEEVLERAAVVVEALPDLLSHAARALVRDLLGTYNGGWNTYDVQRADGTLETVEKPQLSGDEFVSKLRVRRVRVLGESWVTLDYDDPEELFWGHYVHVDFMDGLDLENATAAFDG